MTVQSDLPYKTTPQRTLLYDLFQPEGAKALVVCIHGGAWIGGTKEDFHYLAPHFRERGLACAFIQYRFSFEAPFPAAVEDVRDFVGFARGQASEWGIDPLRIGCYGASAGGYLSCMLGLSPAEEQRANAAVNVCGITDFRDFRAHYSEDCHGWMAAFLGNAAPEEASPSCLATKEAAPTLTFHGDADDIVPVRDAHTFHEAMQAAGAASSLKILPGRGHGFDTETERSLISEGADWLASYLH